MCQSSNNIQDRCDANFISSHGGGYPMQKAQMRVYLVVVQKEKEDHHRQQNEASLKKMEETIDQHKFLLGSLPTLNRSP